MTHRPPSPSPPAQSVQSEPKPEPRATPPAAPAPVLDARAEVEPPQPVRRPTATKPTVAVRDPALDAWVIKSYLRCWKPPTPLPPGEKYAAQIRVVHNADGSLMGRPVLVNPPNDPAWRAYADSAVRAVTKCNPLHVPADYASHFDQWRKMTLHFSPDAAT